MYLSPLLAGQHAREHHRQLRAQASRWRLRHRSITGPGHPAPSNPNPAASRRRFPATTAQPG